MSAVKDVIDGLDETKIDKDWIIKKICEQWISIEHQIYEKNKEIDTSLNRRNPFDDNEINLVWKDGENTVKTYTLTEEEIINLQQAGTKEIKYENLKSNTRYTIEITGNVQLGNTKESIPVTYNYKEFIKLHRLVISTFKENYNNL